MAKTPGLNLPFGIDPVNAVPVDAMYGPYASLAAARSAIPLSLRYDGLTVQITGLGNYYWTAADLSDTGLIAKYLQGSDLLSEPISMPKMDEETGIVEAQRKDGSIPMLLKKTGNDAFVWSDWQALQLFALANGSLIGVGSSAIGFFS
jgi:hypothetical protein